MLMHQEEPEGGESTFCFPTVRYSPICRFLRRGPTRRPTVTVPGESSSSRLGRAIRLCGKRGGKELLFPGTSAACLSLPTVGSTSTSMSRSEEHTSELQS